MNELFTTKQAAEYLGVTASRVRQFILEKRLISYKKGRDHLIEHLNLEEFKNKGYKKRGRHKN